MHPDFQLEFVELAPQMVLVVERESSPQDLGSNLADILPRISAYITQQGHEPAGEPFMRYLNMTDRFLIDPDAIRDVLRGEKTDGFHCPHEGRFRDDIQRNLAQVLVDIRGFGEQVGQPAKLHLCVNRAPGA